MGKFQVKFNLSQTSKEISHFTVGLAVLGNRNGQQQPVSAGSGTLVTVGKVQGILTAAHVLDVLPDDGAVAIAVEMAPQ